MKLDLKRKEIILCFIEQDLGEDPYNIYSWEMARLEEILK